MRLQYVDPHKKHGRWYAALESFGRSRLGQFYAHHVGPRVDPGLYRVTKGRWPSIIGGVSSAPLTTTGAKSGQPREHQITYFHDGNDAIAIASNYGGPKNPQWYYNLRANPECELGNEKFLATEVIDPDDYQYLYGLATKVYAGWADYRLKTDPIGRHIPVFRLTPR